MINATVAKANAEYDGHCWINNDLLMLRLLYGRWHCEVVRSTSATSQNFDQLTACETTYRSHLPRVTQSSGWATAKDNTCDMNASTRIRRETKIMRNIKLLPRYSWGLSSSGTLRGVGRQLIKDVSDSPSAPSSGLKQSVNAWPA